MASVSITPFSRRRSEPTVALTTVPTVIATTIQATPATLASGGRPRVSRRRSTVATTISRRFPAVWPRVTPSGRAP
jgi:hypothetical protein